MFSDLDIKQRAYLYIPVASLFLLLYGSLLSYLQLPNADVGSAEPLGTGRELQKLLKKLADHSSRERCVSSLVTLNWLMCLALAVGCITPT